MMTVLQILEATEGGTRRHLRDLVAALDPREFRVSLAVSCGRDPAFRADVADYAACGVPVFEVSMRRGIAPLADLTSLCRLICCVRRVRPDVIHAHSAKAGFLARLAGALCRVPVVYTPHVFPFQMTCGAAVRRCYWLLERSVRGLTAALVAVSAEEARTAVRLGYAKERIWVILNGVVPCPCGEVAVRASGALKVGFFGRLSWQKGPDLLVEAVADVLAHVPHVRFVLYGAGEEEGALRRLIEGRQLGAYVQLAGACAQAETVARMCEMDVIAVPSRWEGCPYVVLEAFQAGVPLVAAAVGGVPELIRDGVNGVLVEPESAEALCDGLLSVLRDPQKRRRFAEQGRASVAAYTAADMADAVGAVYRAVALTGKKQK